MEDEDFKEVFQQLQGQICVKEGDDKADYHLQSMFLYKLCVPKDEKLQRITEAHTSMVARHFGARKIVAKLQRYVYWPRMQEDVARLLEDAYFVVPTSLVTKRKVYTISYLYPLDPGITSPWILCVLCQQLGGT
jgi:hypothetical protein